MVRLEWCRMEKEEKDLLYYLIRIAQTLHHREYIIYTRERSVFHVGKLQRRWRNREIGFDCLILITLTYLTFSDTLYLQRLTDWLKTDTANFSRETETNIFMGTLFLHMDQHNVHSHITNHTVNITIVQNPSTSNLVQLVHFSFFFSQS